MNMEMQDLAIDYRNRFYKRTRDNGSECWLVRDGKDTPELTELIQEAHGDMSADDYRYAFIVEALNALSDNEDEDDARDSIEADIYTHELTGWLNSRADRYVYCDEAAEEYGFEDKDGKFMGMFSLLQIGQLTEKLEVFYSVLGSLQSLCGAAKDGEEVA